MAAERTWRLRWLAFGMFCGMFPHAEMCRSRQVLCFGTAFLSSPAHQTIIVKIEEGSACC